MTWLHLNTDDFVSFTEKISSYVTLTNKDQKGNETFVNKNHFQMFLYSCFNACQIIKRSFHMTSSVRNQAMQSFFESKDRWLWHFIGNPFHLFPDSLPELCKVLDGIGLNIGLEAYRESEVTYIDIQIGGARDLWACWVFAVDFAFLISILIWFFVPR